MFRLKASKRIPPHHEIFTSYGDQLCFTITKHIDADSGAGKNMVYNRTINPGINPNYNNKGVLRSSRMRNKRRKQTGGTAYGGNVSIKDMLINAAAGVLNKQKKRIATGAKKRKQKVTKPWVEMGEESGAIKQKGGLAIGRRRPRNTMPVIYQYHQ